ncbi:MAG TPA: DUF4388 domain-containing protein [Frankiaceae bacterium]|nr:DUF4388 domain-containing protein [Frankiaceae bacterium]
MADGKGAGVQRGDLKTTPLSDLLKRLADAKATGCVYVQPGARRALEATVGLREGAICNVMMPGAEEAVGARLVANRHLTPSDLAEAREAQETELAAWTLAELLIHLGLADEQEVEALVLEQALAALTDLCEWTSGSWRFRRRERTGPSLPSPLAIEEALATVADRQAQWLELQATLHGADAIVSLAANPENPDGAPDLEMDADGFALLCAIDGNKTLGELASSTGFTLLDAGHKIIALIDSGLVQIAHPSDEVSDDEDLDAEDLHGEASAEGDGGEARSLAAIAAAFSFDGPAVADLEVGLSPVGAPWQPPRTANGDTLASALARVSAALSEAMTGPDEQETAPEPEAEPEAELEPVAEVEVELEPVAEVEAELEPVAEIEVEAVEDEAELETVAEVEVEVEVEAQVEAQIEPVVDEPIVDEDEEFLAEVITLPFAAQDSASDESHEEDAPSQDAEEIIDVVDTVEVEEIVEVEELAEPVEAELEPVESQAEVEVEVEAEAEAEVVEAEVVEPEHVETARESRASAANAARLLSEFSEESVSRKRQPEVEEEPEPEHEAPPAAPEGHAPRPRRENGLADTAALLRELSGLSTETTSSAPRLPNRPTPAPVAAGGGQHARKRKGLFGRS